MKNISRFWSIVVCIVSIFYVSGMTCVAEEKPEHIYISSMEELVRLYHSEDEAGTPREYAAENELNCTGDITLDETLGRVDIVAIGGIRIMKGAALTLQNPNLVVMGAPPTITVEAGGTLVVNAMHALTSEAMPQGGIVIKEGGALIIQAGVSFPEGIIVDQNHPPEDTLPPDDTLPPENALPPDDTLSPEGTKPISNLAGMVVNITQNQILAIRLSFTSLPEDTKHLYLWQSTDGENWTQNMWRDSRDEYVAADYLLSVHNAKGYGFFACRQQIGSTGKVWLRLEVIGGAAEGISNTILIEPTMLGQPANPEVPDDGRSEGNRGGGSQGQADRTGQQTEADVPIEEPSNGDVPLYPNADALGYQQERVLTAKETIVPIAKAADMAPVFDSVENSMSKSESENAAKSSKNTGNGAISKLLENDDQNGTALVLVLSLLVLLSAGAVIRHRMKYQSGRKS